MSLRQTVSSLAARSASSVRAFATPTPPRHSRSTPGGGGVMTLPRRRIPLSLALAGLALIAVLLVVPWVVHAQSVPTAPSNLTAQLVDGGALLSRDGGPPVLGNSPENYGNPTVGRGTALLGRT